MLVLSLLACTSNPGVWPTLSAGAPQAGVAEGTLDLPVGTPLGGYSSRATYLGATSSVDERLTPYNVGFVPSVGVYTRPGIKVLWLENGDQDFVWCKVDVIYSFDKLTDEITRRLSAATGKDLTGKVVLSTAHSHASYGPFDQQLQFFLGGDKYNEEIFQRFAGQVTDVAFQAFQAVEPASIGAGWAKDWDPNDAVYHDRRSENDNLVVWPSGDLAQGKDPYLGMIRVDTAAGDPMAMVLTFGIHGTTLSENNPLVSGDSSEALDEGLEEQFDSNVMVMHVQGPAGDCSPSGNGNSDYASLESLPEHASSAVMGLYDSIKTSADPVKLEAATRSVWTDRESLHVTRNGTVDWYYTPADDTPPDNVVYNADGSLASPIDEFDAPDGAAFCGSTTPIIPGGSVGSSVYPYSTCVRVDAITPILKGLFHIEDSDIVLPLPESTKARTTALRISDVPTVNSDGTSTTAPLFAGFFPGEPTAMYAEQWRRRAKAELGYDMAFTIGYSQDHEGYLLIPEDWLMGGYEPNINVEGPLQGEAIMEGTLQLAKDTVDTTDVREDADPVGNFASTKYPDVALPTDFQPDETADAGTIVTTAPPKQYLPFGLTGVYAVPSTVPRVQGIVQLTWKGGDPMVDEPEVTLERQDSGNWVAVTTHAGRPLTDKYPDIVISETPDPQYPATAVQTHYWWAGWQAVGHVVDRTSMPLGTYRLHVRGRRYTGGDQHWPWSTTSYEVLSDPFTVTPGALTVSTDATGLWVGFPEPVGGWRLLDVAEYNATAPVRGSVDLSFATPSGAVEQDLSADQVTNGLSHLTVSVPAGATAVTATDAAGNAGTLTF